MKLEVLLNESLERLQEFKVDSPVLQAESILVHVLSCSRGGMVPEETDLELEAEEVQRVRNLVAGREEKTPVEYFREPLTFGGIQVSCSPKACIPRSDSEVLVDLTVCELQGKPGGTLIDVGTGVGAIALAIAKGLPSWHVIGTDITMGCLMVAHQNTRKYLPEASDRISWEVSDLLAQVDEQVECVVGNLPYVRSEFLKRGEGEHSVEPDGALDGGGDGLEFIRRVIPQAAEMSHRLFLEAGPLQTDAVAELMQQAGYNRIEVFKDFQARERFVFGYKK
ncbi:MAG: HemK family protein methyltransferase [Verrucomicrobiota bacterium]